MFFLKSFLSLILISTLFSCRDELVKGISPCLDEKINEFIELDYAEQIIRIDRTTDTLYWFVVEFVDAGEAVYNTDCEVVCITDLEGVTTEPYCDETHLGLNFPRTVIWEK